MGAYNIVNAASLVSGQPEDVGQVLANFQAIQTVLNGNLDDTNINAAAAIALTKIAAGGAANGQFLKFNGAAWVPANLPSASFASNRGTLGSSGIAGTGAAVAAQNLGYGATMTLTPVNSGKVKIMVTGMMAGGYVNCNVLFQLEYGTGAAPAANSAQSGTLVGNEVGAFGQSANLTMFAMVYDITGLALTVPVWFDIAERLSASQGGQTPGLDKLNFVLLEHA